MQIGDSRGRMRGCRRLHCKILGGGREKISLWPDSFGTYFREKPREKIGCADAAVNQKKKKYSILWVSYGFLTRGVLQNPVILTPG